MPPDDAPEGAVRDLIIKTILDWPTPRSERVSYQSKGICLIFGPTERVETAINLLPPGLQYISLSPRLPDQADTESCFIGQVTQIIGHLGTYRAQVDIGGKSCNIGATSEGNNDLFDLVLDLSDSTLLDREILPLGYFHCSSNNPEDIGRTIRQFGKFIGHIYKPRYFDFDVTLCAHDRQDVAGCRRCLTVCPAGAIEVTSEHEIAIDPYLCQGCGSCTQSCPTGALSYAYPRRKVLLQRLRQLVDGYSSISDGAPGVLFYEDDLHHAHKLSEISTLLPSSMLPFPVHSVSSIGMETWLAALSFGVAQILVLRPTDISKRAEKSLGVELKCSYNILSSLGIEQDRIRYISNKDLHNGLAESDVPPLVEAAWDVEERHNGKRATLLQALGRLVQLNQQDLALSGCTERGLGSLHLDSSRCTLCQACVHLCPTAALRSSDPGELYFSESACVQCGLCVNGCPEHALQLTAAFHHDPARQSYTVLHESLERIECLHCGRPFADKRFVEKSIAVVSELPSFTADQVDLLRLCPECRREEAMKQ